MFLPQIELLLMNLSPDFSSLFSSGQTQLVLTYMNTYLEISKLHKQERSSNLWPPYHDFLFNLFCPSPVLNRHFTLNIYCNLVLVTSLCYSFQCPITLIWLKKFITFNLHFPCNSISILFHVLSGWLMRILSSILLHTCRQAGFILPFRLLALRCSVPLLTYFFPQTFDHFFDPFLFDVTLLKR